MEEAVPDLITPVYGKRGWKVYRYRKRNGDSGFVLKPFHILAYEDFFLPRTATKARCICVDCESFPSDVIHHVSPNIDCSCGIYALKFESPVVGTDRHYFQSIAHDVNLTLRLALPTGVEKEFITFVVGAVALWGKVIVGTRGYRAEYGMPVALVRLPVEEEYSFAEEAQREVENLISKTYEIPVYDSIPGFMPEVT